MLKVICSCISIFLEVGVSYLNRTQLTHMQTKPRPATRRLHDTFYALAASVLLLIAAGCKSVPVYEQTRLAEPQNQFAETHAYRFQSPILSSLEPGTATSGGGVASGCTSCR